MVYGNRMSLNDNAGRPCYYTRPSESEAYMSAAHIIRFIGTVIHELIGHGTGKLLTETAQGEFNFDRNDPPVSPVTGEAIQTWYRPGETWTGVFGKLATTVEECRAFLMSSYLADNRDILGIFGYDQDSTPTADDRELHIPSGWRKLAGVTNVSSDVFRIPAHWSGRSSSTPEFQGR